MGNKKKQKTITDFSGAFVWQGDYRNLKIKVNGNSKFIQCSFFNCTFIGKGKYRATFEYCVNA